MSAGERSADCCATSRGCITCADEGIPMRVLSLHAEEGLAVCADASGRSCDVMTGLVGEAAVGDLLLVHAGTALVRLPEASGEGA